MNVTNLPPLPPEGARGSDVCAIMHLYLAVWNDLSKTEMLRVSAHLESCVSCAREHRILSRATQLVANLPASSPSARVDQAVMAAIAAHSGKGAPARQRAPEPLRKPARRRRSSPLPGLLATAAVLAILALASVHFLMPGLSLPLLNGTTAPHVITTQQSFALPANLSWDSYVLYLHQTMTTANGEQYTVTTYHDMTSGMTNAETVMDNKLDVVVVDDNHDALGMDMMHHVAQWGAQKWSSDVSMFDLNALRSDLKDRQAVYDGTTTFQGKKVYRIRFTNGLILLLNMHYMPVNVLQPSGGSGSPQPMYDSVKWLAPSQVPGSMWDMSVPAGFKMGKLPARPH